MRNPTWVLSMTIGAAMLFSTAALAADEPVVSEATPEQQEEMKSDAQATMQDTQSAAPTSSEMSQEPAQPQAEGTAPAGQDQPPSSSN